MEVVGCEKVEDEDNTLLESPNETFKKFEHYGLKCSKLSARV